MAIARGLVRRLPPSFDLDDLIAAGNVALTQAAGRYNPEEHGGAPFSVYARVVVRGAIIESVRRRHWDDATQPPLEDAAEPLSQDPAPIAIVERRQLLERVAAAARWLTFEQRAVLDMRYGPEELSLDAIGRRMGRGTTWAFDQHKGAIEELRARCGGASGEESLAVRRLFVVPAKTKVVPIDDAEKRQRAEVDELGRLEERLLPFRNDLKRIEQLRKSIRGRFDSHAADKTFEAAGDLYTVAVGARGNEKVVNHPTLIKRIGLKAFAAIAKVTIKAIEENVAPEVASEVISLERSGHRDLTVLKRDNGPTSKAA